MESCIYESLAQHDSFRLLRIEKSADEERQLHCTISSFSLSDHPPFICLSYTWDNGEDLEEKEEIQSSRPLLTFQNNTKLDVMRNLHDALIKISQRWNERQYFWIDYICINQSDIIERNAQVNIMGNIFQEADEVLVWLGRDTGGEVDPIELVHQLSTIVETRSEEFGSGTVVRNYVGYMDSEFLQHFELSHWTMQDWEALVNFLRKKWFTRTWILQEVALAREMTVLYGDRDLRWGDLVATSEFLDLTGLDSGLTEIEINTKNRRQSSAWNGRVGYKIRVIDAMRAWSKGEANQSSVKISKIISGTPSIYSSAASFLNYILLQTLGYDATDPRDKIFGILGVVQEVIRVKGLEKLPITADYTKSVEEVYRETAEFILNETNSLGMLTYILRSTASKVKGLPSWVPDFSSPGTQSVNSTVAGTDKIPFDASNFQDPFPARFRVEGTRLHVRHILLGSIVQIGDFGFDFIGDGRIEDSIRVILNSSLVYKPTAQPRVEVFWRTLIVDRGAGNEHPAPTNHGSSFAAMLRYVLVKAARKAVISGQSRSDFLDSLTNTAMLAKSDNSTIIPDRDELQSVLDEFGVFEDHAADLKLFQERALNTKLYKEALLCHSALARVFNKRCLFRTADGYIGLATINVKLGDEICICKGSLTPFIVRRKEVEGAPSTGIREHEFIGEAYVHGVMHGEALDDMSLQWQELCLV